MFKNSHILGMCQEKVEGYLNEFLWSQCELHSHFIKEKKFTQRSPYTNLIY